MYFYIINSTIRSYFIAFLFNTIEFTLKVSISIIRKYLLKSHVTLNFIFLLIKEELGELEFFFRKIPLHQQKFWWSWFLLIRLGC